MSYFLFLLGFVLLIGGANWLVDGASAIGRKYNIPDIVIGLTIVSFGTSLPELIISLFSSTEGATDLAISNVLGSNIFNVFIIVGVSALISPINVGSNTTWKEIPYSLWAAILLGISSADILLDGAATNVVSRIDGLVYLGFFVVFIFYSYNASKTGEVLGNEQDHKDLPMNKSVLLIIVGLIGLYIGGRWIVDGAVDVARLFGMNEALLGITVVATATSFPELVTSIVAALKKNSDIAIGNALGSNIFNIFLVLGISATVTPLPFKVEMLPNLYMAIFANIALFMFILTGKGKRISKIEGGMLVAIYVAYISYQIMQLP